MDLSPDWLPYVDQPIPDAELAAAKALMDSETAQGSPEGTSHPSMRDMPVFKSSELQRDLLERAARGEKLSAIDMSRYESGALEAPSSTPSDPGHLQDWIAAVNRAATLRSYLTMREQNLALLEAYGKNAWLIGNDQVESQLKRLEKELAEEKERTEQVEAQRRVNQEASKPEFESLQAEWRKRIVGKTQTEIATAELNEQLHSMRSS